jgi:hypothetical protein
MARETIDLYRASGWVGELVLVDAETGKTPV